MNRVLFILSFAILFFTSCVTNNYYAVELEDDINIYDNYRS